MFLFSGAVLAAVSVIGEEKAFQDEVAAMPEDMRDAAIQRRKDWKQSLQRQRERDETIEAIKPHNLWSFLGLGSK